MTNEEFFSNIDDWISAPKSNWNHITCLAYFCKKYEQANGVVFRLVPGKKGPTLGKEAADFAKLVRMFYPENMDELSPKFKESAKQETMVKIYNYINWMFDYKFRNNLGSVNGTRFFHIPAIIVEFERMYAKVLKSRGATTTFSDFLSWCKENAPQIFERHQLESKQDLEMIKAYTEFSPNATEEIKVLQKANELGIL